MGRSQAVRHRFLVSAFAGSNPAAPAPSVAVSPASVAVSSASVAVVSASVAVSPASVVSAPVASVVAPVAPVVASVAPIVASIAPVVASVRYGLSCAGGVLVARTVALAGFLGASTVALAVLLATGLATGQEAKAQASRLYEDHPILERQWPKTDFETRAVALEEILMGGPPKDGIPAIDEPRFEPAQSLSLGDTEPLIRLSVNGETRGYPLRVLIWHEIVNDTIGGLPVAVTYCPLCNTAIVFDRRLDGKPARFGTTGLLRNSDLVMYDDLSETWWQQYDGTAIIGVRTGEALPFVPSRVVSFKALREENPNTPVLVPNAEGFRRYGANPYVGYDSSSRPFLYDGELPEGIAPLAYVVVVEDQAWTLDLIRDRKRVLLQGEQGTLEIRWQEGVASALDHPEIAESREIGSVEVRRQGLEVAHKTTFAFVYFAFSKQGIIHRLNSPDLAWDRRTEEEKLTDAQKELELQNQQESPPTDTQEDTQEDSKEDSQGG